MTAIEIAPFLKEYGPWALCALLIAVIKILDGRNNILVEKVLTVAGASKTAADNAAGALKVLEGTTAAIVTAVQTLDRGQENELRDLRHTVANWDTILKAIHERMVRPAERGRE